MADPLGYYNREVAKLFGDLIHSLMQVGDPAGLVAIRQGEPPSHILIGGDVPMPVQHQSVEYSARLEISALLRLDVEAWAAMVARAADAALVEFYDKVFPLVRGALENQGTFRSSAAAPSWEAYLELIETMQASFDKDGNWTPPKIMAGENAAKAWKSLPPPSPEQLERLNAIVERKRRENLPSRPVRQLD